MEIFETIDTRHTTRNFDSYVPTDDEIKRIINSARLAPSAMNTQNWKFLAILNNDVKEKMAKCVLDAYDEILSGLNSETKEKVERFKAHSTFFFAKVPLVIVCIEEKAPAFMENVLEEAGFEKEDIALMRPDSFLLSMGGAIENILLSSHALGLSSCWMVAPVLGARGMKKVLNLGDNQKIVSILSIGKPSKNEGDKRSPKKSLEDILQIIK